MIMISARNCRYALVGVVNCSCWLSAHAALPYHLCFLSGFPKSMAIWPPGSWSSLIKVMASSFLVPSHYLNQCWCIMNQTLENKIKWNLNQNINIFIHKHAFENITCKMTAILLGVGSIIYAFWTDFVHVKLWLGVAAKQTTWVSLNCHKSELRIGQVLINNYENWITSELMKWLV